MKIQNRRNSTLIMLILIAINSFSQSDISTCFIRMPDDLCPSLTAKNKHELLEYHKAAMGDSIENRLGEFSYLQKLDSLNGHLVLKPTANTRLELKLLKNSSVIAMIRTACAPICHSTIQFYDTAWNSVEMGFVPPQAIDWLLAANDKEMSFDPNHASNLLSTSFVSLRFDNESIVASNHTIDFISVDDKDKLKSVMNQSDIIFQFNNGSWTRK